MFRTYAQRRRRAVMIKTSLFLVGAAVLFTPKLDLPQLTDLTGMPLVTSVQASEYP